jgi:inward rectifier potassium channel
MPSRKTSLPPPAPSSRLPTTRVLGRKASFAEDFYHTVLTRPWWQFFTMVACVFVMTNAVFALIYASRPGAIANARPGSLEDAFFFSVQTMATIGYGSMAPVSLFAHVMVTIEAIIAMLGGALVTGLTFAKFSRPTARVLFANNMVIGPRDGVPHLMFRMANWRHNTILEAQLRFILLVEERTREGQVWRRPVELPLVRDRTPLFGMTWTAMHCIDETSPFFGEGAMDRLRARKAEIFLSLLGMDETFAQQVHARHSYKLADIIPNAYFADVLSIEADGTRVIDYADFHEVVPIISAPALAADAEVARVADPHLLVD